jgi:dihydrofolate reductase
MNTPCDLLIGRKTFDIWAPFWPQHNDIWPAVNTATKYVASNTMTSHEWHPSVFLGGHIAEKITKIKQQEGPDLHVYGSANLVQTLVKHDLVDAFWLKIFPMTLGGGKRLFADGTIPAAVKVTESTVTSKGVIIVNYERAGAVPPPRLVCREAPEGSPRSPQPQGRRDCQSACRNRHALSPKPSSRSSPRSRSVL